MNFQASMARSLGRFARNYLHLHQKGKKMLLNKAIDNIECLHRCHFSLVIGAKKNKENDNNNNHHQ